MRLIILKESYAGEARVAASPETVKKFITLGFSVGVIKGAGIKAGIMDDDFGADIVSNAKGADIVIGVKRPELKQLEGVNAGCLVISIADPYGNEEALKTLAEAGVSAFAMELMPRITRAQVMDVLSSQANLAGYRAVIEGAYEFGRALPMMMTAAGTVPAAKIFVMGAGVAGLQAIATARRLGAIVTATDVRPASKEQVESLGAKFVAVIDDEFKSAETAGGYAKEMSKDYQAKQAELVASHIAKQDIVITTALIPGRPAPKLISETMIATMRAGSVLVDLAVERGGNIEGVIADKITTSKNGVKLVGHVNVAGRLAATASSLYAKNLFAFIETLVNKADKTISVNLDDDLVKATLLTHLGSVIHPNFSKAAS